MTENNFSNSPVVNNRPVVNGMCEQLHDFNLWRGHSLLKAYEKLEEMKVGSFRAWMHFGYIFTDYDRLSPRGVKYFHKIFDDLTKHGIGQTVVMSHNWFLEGTNRGRPVMAAPPREMSEGSAYRRFLEMYETSWYLAAKEFGEIKYWETGNELNIDVFLKPAASLGDPSAPPFGFREKVDIMTDMMFCASRGIKRANPEAVCVMPGLTAHSFEGGDIARSLEFIYENIESGAFGSENSGDFFDMLCWHPYCRADFSAREWKRVNDEAYAVAERHGDGGKKVFFSEFGFSDGGSAANDEYLASAEIEKFRLIRTEMPYVESAHAFRLFDDYAAYGWGGNHEKYFGFYRDAFEGCTIKARGKALRDLYNGVI